MFVEGDDECFAFVLAGVGKSLPDDLLMSEVYAVKNSDGEADFVAGSGEFTGLLNHLHPQRLENPAGKLQRNEKGTVEVTVNWRRKLPGRFSK